MHLKSFPSCFLVPLNTTVLAGMLTPIANVSVANSTFTSPRLKQISTISCWCVGGCVSLFVFGGQ